MIGSEDQFMKELEIPMASKISSINANGYRIYIRKKLFITNEK